jgi:hypothetical protein
MTVLQETIGTIREAQKQVDSKAISQQELIDKRL